MSELIKIAARLARREGLPDDTPASVFNWLGAESIAIRNEADKHRALIETLERISDDYHPDRDADAPLALQEMRDAISAALAAAKELNQ